MNALFGAAVSYGKLGFDASGKDCAYFDAVLAEFSVERLREAGLGELGGAVDGFSWGPLQAGYRRDEENGAALLLDHVRDGIAGEEEAGTHVCVHEGVVVFDGCVDQVLVVPCSGVIDEDVKVSKGIDGESDSLLRC